MKKMFGRLSAPFKNKRGFTYAEVVVAVALFAIIGTLGYTMFSMSTRYNSNAKREEAKRAQAEVGALKETFQTTNVSGDSCYVIYSSDSLVKSTTGTASLYFINITVKTNYGNVYYSVPLTKTSYTKGLDDYGNEFTVYNVSSDSAPKRKVLIYNTMTASSMILVSDLTDKLK